MSGSERGTLAMNDTRDNANGATAHNTQESARSPMTHARGGTRDAVLRDELAALDRDGYVVLERVLSADELSEIRRALAPHLDAYRGRNDFEGIATERVYSLVGVNRVFEDLAEHPRILAILDAVLEPGYLLTASQAIHIHPGETPQPFHTDDGFYSIPRPRPPVSYATIWAIDDFTKTNGATQAIRGSHRWNDEQVGQILERIDFRNKPAGSQPSESTDRLDRELDSLGEDLVMPAGSVVVFAGTLMHRGGRSTGTRSRLALSNQYCQPWARQQENFFLSIPRERAARMSPRVQALIGYSIHPPFMGHVKGIHPRKLLER